MSLDVPVPDPPSLHGPQPRSEYSAIDAPAEEPEDDYRREEVAEILEAGAWHDAFEEWTTQTGLLVADFELVTEHELVDEFDFYWDPTTDEVGYQAPTLPEAVRRDLEVGDVDEIGSAGLAWPDGLGDAGERLPPAGRREIRVLRRRGARVRVRRRGARVRVRRRARVGRRGASGHGVAGRGVRPGRRTVSDGPTSRK
ncbi:hypothetical protein ACFQH8_07135 [Halomicroarcula sp. GCM10025710]